MEEQTAKGKKEKVMSTVKANPLCKEKIYVRFIPHELAAAGNDKHHALYGGRADGATDTFCVPIITSTGQYKNVLTNDEKDFLEEALGLDSNALSVYKKENNYWDNYKIKIIAKEGLYLDLSNPDDFIKYKVLLANTDRVAPSVQERIDRPKKTYLYEIVREAEDTAIENFKMDAMMQSYKEFGKIEDDIDTLRVLMELLDGRPYDANTPREFFRAKANDSIQDDPKRFLHEITDPMLHTKVLIRRGTELGVILKRGDYYFLKSDNTPLCDNGENPTLSVAAKFLNLPSHQDIKFILESELGKSKKK